MDETLQTDKFMLTYKELSYLGIWNDYSQLRNRLYKANQRKNCILIQGQAFVVGGKAFLMVGVGGIHYLDSLAQMDEVDGIIGNGNSIFLSKDFSHIYSAHTPEELVERYQTDHYKEKLLDGAPLAKIIFLQRTFYKQEEFDKLKKKAKTHLFEKDNTFATNPIRFAGKIKARLRKKFIDTARIAHMTYRPVLYKKELLFDSGREVKSAMDSFRGIFCLLYSLWRQDISDGFGVGNVRKLARETYNPTDAITPHLLSVAKKFI